MDEVDLHASFATSAPGAQPLAPGQVHVWAVPLHGDPEPFAALLSAQERQRLERFRFADHRRRFQIGHGALRTILAGYLGVGPKDLEFRQGPRGKPYLVGAGPFFNLSHSGKLGLIAVSETELGADCEKVRHLESLTEIARKHFSPAEFAVLDGLAGEARQLAFYRCWTRKEAYIKAIGAGLSMPLDTFDVTLGADPALLACRDSGEDPRRWSMLDVSPGPEFVAAVALRTPAAQVVRLRLPVDRP